MIRGVNKQILEIKNTESRYFERVIFFVKPEYVHLDGEKLEKEANKYVSLAGTPPKSKERKKAPRKKLWMVAALTVIFLIATIVVVSILEKM